MTRYDDQDPTVRLGFAEPAETTVLPDAAALRATPYGAPPEVLAAERPTIRWGALVWGLLFGLTAAVTLWILVDPGRRDAIDDWFLTLNPLAATLYALVAVGTIVVLFGLVGLIRRGERTRR